jgi:hypothetical protein
MVTRSLHAHLKKNALYLVGMSAGGGVSFASGEPIIVPVTDADEIGRGLERAFAYSKIPDEEGRPRTREAWTEHKKRFLDATGFKSMSDFERGSKSATVNEHEDGYDIIREERDGGGWVGYTDRAVKLPTTATMRDLAEQLLAVLNAPPGPKRPNKVPHPPK